MMCGLFFGMKRKHITISLETRMIREKADENKESLLSFMEAVGPLLRLLSSIIRPNSVPNNTKNLLRSGLAYKPLCFEEWCLLGCYAVWLL
jgi:hypothetical protein